MLKELSKYIKIINNTTHPSIRTAKVITNVDICKKLTDCYYDFLAVVWNQEDKIKYDNDVLILGTQLKAMAGVESESCRFKTDYTADYKTLYLLCEKLITLTDKYRKENEK